MLFVPLFAQAPATDWTSLAANFGLLAIVLAYIERHHRAWRKHDDKRDARDAITSIAMQITATELSIASQRIAWAMDKSGADFSPTDSQARRENPLHAHIKRLGEIKAKLEKEAAAEADSKDV